MNRIFLLSPAKINLVLQILRKRTDGYHEIWTIFQKITLFDEIEVKKGTRSFFLKMEPNFEIPLDKNLAFRAYQKFKECFKVKDNCSIWIKKNIPLGSGLGGGSSNAATILKALAKLFEIDDGALYSLGRAIGADINFFLSPYFSAIGEGIGEKLTPFFNFSAWYLLVYPGFEISTKWAYEKLELTNNKNLVYYSEKLPPWKQSLGLINDFKALIWKKFKEYEVIEKTLKEEGAKAVSLSGTGSTVFGIFENTPPFQSYIKIKTKFPYFKVFLVKNLE